MHDPRDDEEIISKQSKSTDLTPDQQNLELDIIEINNQLTSVQSHAKSVERAIESLYRILSDGQITDAKVKVNTYRTINELRVTLSNFVTNISKILDLKFKYRTQQATIKFNLLKVIQEKQTTDMNKMMDAIQNLSSAISEDESEVAQDSIKSIKDDLETNTYRLG